MSDQRYQAGVLHGIKVSVDAGRWPDKIPELGRRRGGQPFARCVRCPDDEHPAIAMTFVRFGGTPLCRRHAEEAA